MNFENSVKAVESYIDNIFRCYPHLNELELLKKFHSFANDNDLPIVLELIGYAYFPLAQEKVAQDRVKKDLTKFTQYQFN